MWKSLSESLWDVSSAGVSERGINETNITSGRPLATGRGGAPAAWEAVLWVPGLGGGALPPPGEAHALVLSEWPGLQGQVGGAWPLSWHLCDFGLPSSLLPRVWGWGWGGGRRLGQGLFPGPPGPSQSWPVDMPQMLFPILS